MLKVEALIQGGMTQLAQADISQSVGPSINNDPATSKFKMCN